MRDGRFPDARILIVDDEPGSVRSLSHLLERAGYVNLGSTTDPAAVRTIYLEQDPDLVLLDLHMPALDGIGVLEQLRAAAKDFVTKPFEREEILLRIRNVLQTRFLHRELTVHNQALEQRVSERTRELDSAHLDTLERLALAAEFRDDETGRHTERVGEAAALLGSALGLPQEDVFFIRRAAPLHDVGKISIPDVVLRKPGPLTPEEWVVMKRHTAMGAQILLGGRSHVIQLAEEIARSHHEHWDGNGYPEGRSGEAIPLAARLVMVADVFDALTSDRVYRAAWPVAKVLSYIQAYAGQRFDPAIAALCKKPAVRRALIDIRGESGSRLGSAGRQDRELRLG